MAVVRALAHHCEKHRRSAKWPHEAMVRSSGTRGSDRIHRANEIERGGNFEFDGLDGGWWQGCDVLDFIVGALKPLKEMADVLAGEMGMTVSAVLASSPVSPIFSTHTRKKSEPWIQNHVSDVGPYTRVGSVADRENCAWARKTFEPSGSMRVRRNAIRVSARIERSL